ncbi:glycoside hydrolase family 97 protein [Roseimarinus sediminis]|uniref:glycoside hydrolase family 97 protein n=1 Tax=Roseimarinus sediminis TaxID=1610899 RepID=UPI003D1952A4
MKHFSISLTILVLFTVTALAKSYELSSPDNAIAVNIDVNEIIRWNVTFKGQPAIGETVIALDLSDKKVGINDQVKKQRSELLHERIEPVVPHKDAIIEAQYRQLSLSLASGYDLLFRVYNDGVAYRFVNRSKKPNVVYNEKMQLNFPSGTTSLFPKEESMYSHNERLYPKVLLDTLSKADFCSLPVYFESVKGVKVLFTETDLHDYPCMYLQGSEDGVLETLFPKYVLEAVPNADGGPDRNQIITKEAEYIAQIQGGKEFPWRLFIISDDDRTFVESNLAFQLASPNVLQDTDWIKPGKVAWDWYNANNIYGVDFKSGLNTATYKYYIDFAADNNIEYVILDEGWTKSTTEILENNPDIDVAELIRYGKEKEVDIILWVLWKPLDENLEEILDTYQQWGAKGIKVDFMQRSDQYMVNSYERIAREAAKRRLLVDFHGAFKPSGLRGRYPNVLSYEGVKGNENNKWSTDITPEHTVTIPFIRMAAGPMDFTPGSMINTHPVNYSVSFERPMSMGTRCHQLAMYVVYESPIQMLCESPSTYRREQEAVDFITQIPVVWDETQVLEAKVADYLLIARRKGNTWYVGAMTDATPRTLELDLSFLGSGNYHAEIMKDGINADRFAQDYAKEEKPVDQNTQLKIQMASGGGWAAIIRAN